MEENVQAAIDGLIVTNIGRALRQPMVSLFFTNKRIIVAKTVGLRKMFGWAVLLNPLGYLLATQLHSKIMSNEASEKGSELMKIDVEKILDSDNTNFSINYEEINQIILYKPK